MNKSPRPQTDNLQNVILTGVAGGAALAGIALLSQGADTVYAHDTTDTPATLHMEPGDTVWDNAAVLRFTPDETKKILESYGLTTQEQWDNPGFLVGDVVDVPVEVQETRRARLGEGHTVVLEEGETIWSAAIKHGVPASNIPDLLDLIDDNNGEEELRVDQLPVGYEFEIPDALIGDRVVVNEGDTIIQKLEEAGVEDPMRILDEVFRANNNMTEEKARNLDPGTVIIVPDGIIPDDNSDVAEAPEAPVQPNTSAAVEAPETPTPSEPTPPHSEQSDSIIVNEGSTIIDELEEAGVEDPMRILDEVFEANNNMTEEKARNLDPGTVIIVPDGIIPDNSPEEPPASQPPIPSESYQPLTSATLNSNGGVGTEEYGPPVPTPVYNQPPAPLETTDTPEAVVPLSINDVLIEMRSGYETGTADIENLVGFITNNFEHPEIDPDNGITEENVHLLYKLPKPQAGFNYDVNTATCNKEAITSATMLAFIIATQDYAHWLTQNDGDFSRLNDIWKLVLADLNSGVHETHQYGQAADLQSVFNDFTNPARPDGPLFMSGTDGFEFSFTEKVIRFMQEINLSGEQVAEHVIMSSEEMEFNVTGANRRGDFVVDDDEGGHYDHTHLLIRDRFRVAGFFSRALPLSCDDSSTGGHVEFDEAPINTVPEEPAENSTPPEGEQETNVSIDSLLSDAARNYQVVDPITAYVTSKNSTNNGGNLSFDEAYGPTINASDVYILLRSEGATHEEAVILTAVASRETGLRPGSVGDVEHVTDGQITASYGLFQIMALSGDYRDATENLNPRLAAKNALMLMRQSGLDPWETFMPDQFTVDNLADAIDLSHRRRPLSDERARDIATGVLNQVEAIRVQVDSLLGA